MKQHALWLLLFVSSCAPEQPEETRGCTYVSECPMGEVCDGLTGRCIAEPSNRFLGAFECEVDGEGFGVSEVVGRIADDRWALPAATCSLGTSGQLFLLNLTSVFSDDAFWVFLDAADLSGASRAIGPAIDLDWARMVNEPSALAFGYSREGVIDLSARPERGDFITGYLDVTMYETGDEPAVFGVPCPRGLADCGYALSDAGGAQVCIDLGNGPTCTRECAGNGDCSRGDGVCVQGACTKRCVNHEDCESPLRCTQGNPGEENGCF